MKTSQTGIDLIKQFEGFSSVPYRCPAGVVTIGYGSTRYDTGISVHMSNPPITEHRAVELLAATLEQYEACVMRVCAGRALTQNQFDALVSLTYNIGCQAFSKSTMAAEIQAGDMQGAEAQFERWNRGGDKVLPGLVRRRAAEKNLFAL